MNEIDPFIVVWCAFVAIIVVVNVGLAIYDLRVGSSRLVVGRGERMSRTEQSLGFWLAISGKLLTLPLGALMIWFVWEIAPK